MPSPLHKVPLGLLELFRLKTLGRSPEMFGDTVIPIVDGLETYAAAELQTAASASSGAAAINGATGLTASSSVASFQWLWGIGGSFTLGAAAGTKITWHIGVVVPQGNSECCIGSGELSTVVVAEQLQFGITLPRPLVLRAGSSWYARVHGDAGGADHVLFATALFVPAANLT